MAPVFTKGEVWRQMCTQGRTPCEDEGSALQDRRCQKVGRWQQLGGGVRVPLTGLRRS